MSKNRTHAQSPTHRLMNLIVPSVSLIIVSALFVSLFTSNKLHVLDLTWRPFGAIIIGAIVINSLTLALLLLRGSSRQGSYYYFMTMNIATLLFLVINLLFCLSGTPQGAAFWQSMLPLAWITIPAMMLFFALSYSDEHDLPTSPAIWVAGFFSITILTYLAGSTDLIESHHVVNSQLTYWGYQNGPGSSATIVFAWIFLFAGAAVTALVRLYRRTLDTNNRRQIRIFLWGFAQVFFFSIVCDSVVYAINPVLLPPASPLYFTILNVAISYGILRYSFFRISSASLAPTILKNLSEAVIGLNLAMQIEFANSGAEKVLGHREDTIRGKQVDSFLGQELFSKMISELGAGSADVALENQHIMSGDGATSIPVNVTISRAYGDRKQLIGYVVILQNVSELMKKSQELEHEKANVEKKVVARTQELREERARLRASIEGLAVGFALIADDGTISIQNQALQRILGLAADPKSLAGLDAVLSNAHLEKKSKESISSGKPITLQEVSLGSKILRIFLGPVVLSDVHSRNVIGTVILVEDITEMKVLERSKDEFFSIASHELRTPLTAIRGNASMMQNYYQEQLSDPELKEMVNDIEDSSIRLIQIVNDFLDMARLEQHKVAIEATSIAVEPIIESIAYEMKAILKEKSIYMNIDTMQLNKLPQVYADPNRVKQILYNLTGNAAKFTTKGGITITTKADSKSVEILVSDTGHGIPVESQKMLFHKFQQASSNILTRDSTHGTGLGLYISRLLADRMGGSLVLESSIESQGSTFGLKLPIATEKYIKDNDHAKELKLDDLEENTIDAS